MALTREAWVTQLRSYKGTKFMHQGRGKNIGLDCIGLLVCAARDLGIAHGADRIKGYSRAPTDGDFDKWAGHFAVQLPYNRLQSLQSQIELGDVITFWIEREGLTRHVAVYTGTDNQGRPMMIHSYAKQDRGVMEMPINPNYWTRRVSRIFRLHEFCEE